MDIIRLQLMKTMRMATMQPKRIMLVYLMVMGVIQVVMLEREKRQRQKSVIAVQIFPTQ